MNEIRIRLGVSGWEHPNWAGVFYPEDMPTDWRLAYYNTQFDCVWLNYPDWVGSGSDVLAEWVADTREAFVFLLEAGPSEGSTEADLRRLLQAGRGLPSSRADDRLIWFDAEVNLRALAERLRAQTGDVYLLSADADLATIDKVRQLIVLLGFGR